MNPVKEHNLNLLRGSPTVAVRAADLDRRVRSIRAFDHLVLRACASSQIIELALICHPLASAASAVLVITVGRIHSWASFVLFFCLVFIDAGVSGFISAPNLSLIRIARLG